LYAEIIINKNNQDLSENSKHWDARTTSPCHAYQDIFNRRLKAGQCYYTPFLGWKEFTPSYFGVFRESTRVQEDISLTISSMLREVFSAGYNTEPLYTYDRDVVIRKGVLTFAAKDSKND
jgi:CRISPR-associated protein Cas5d